LFRTPGAAGKKWGDKSDDGEYNGRHEHACNLLLGAVVTGGDRGICAAECVAIRAAGESTGDVDIVHHTWVKNAESEVVNCCY
jgi:hypothetical protein